MTSDKNNELVLNEAENSNAKGSKRFTVSRRDVLKAAWTVPVVMAVAPPAALAAGSGQNDHHGGGGCDGGLGDYGHDGHDGHDGHNYPGGGGRR